MHVKLSSIMAGPEGCADAGTTIPVSDTKAQALIKGGFGRKVSGPTRETAAVDAAQMAERERQNAEAEARAAAEQEKNAKSTDVVLAALARLDRDDDEDWTAAGKPAMDRVKELTGSLTLQRSDVDAIAPDFRRDGNLPDPAKTATDPNPQKPAKAVRSSKP